VINQKLEALRSCLKRIEAKCPAQPQALLTDLDLQDILAINLSRAVQLAVAMGAQIVAQLEVQTPGTVGQTSRTSTAVVQKWCGIWVGWWDNRLNPW
jgi:hypothetical protein